MAFFGGGGKILGDTELGRVCAARSPYPLLHGATLVIITKVGVISISVKRVYSTTPVEPWELESAHLGLVTSALPHSSISCFTNPTMP